jgi:hypothetical protein
MTAPAPAPCPREKQVIITVDASGIKVVPDRFHISKSRNEEVLWTCNVDFTVDFTESPFNDTQFNNQYPFSGLARRDVIPSATKLYKYTVTAGGRQLDPDGQVDR